MSIDFGLKPRTIMHIYMINFLQHPCGVKTMKGIQIYIKRVHHQRSIYTQTKLGSCVDFNAFVPWYPPLEVCLVVFNVSLDLCFLVSFPMQNLPTHLLFDSIFSRLALFAP